MNFFLFVRSTSRVERRINSVWNWIRLCRDVSLHSFFVRSVFSLWVIHRRDNLTNRILIIMFFQRMSSRKRPHEATKPATPTNGIDPSLQEINIHNGSNGSSHSNGDSASHLTAATTTSDQYAVKLSTNRPVRKKVYEVRKLTNVQGR